MRENKEGKTKRGTEICVNNWPGRLPHSYFVGKIGNCTYPCCSPFGDSMRRPHLTVGARATDWRVLESLDSGVRPSPELVSLEISPRGVAVCRLILIVALQLALARSESETSGSQYRREVLLVLTGHMVVTPIYFLFAFSY